MDNNKLVPPCSYQGGKQKLAKQIIDIIYEENNINNETIFYDLCCGSGSVSLELINRGFNPNNITMIDNSCFGQFWEDISNNKFDIKIFEQEINKIPSLESIQQYLKNLSNEYVNKEKIVYHYLLLQAGAFGSKQIWIENNKWKNNTFRNYWLPTETSNRRSPVNPMMPMPNTMFNRIENIINKLSSNIIANKEDVFYTINKINMNNKNIIIYIDPPYYNTTGYNESFNIYELKDKIPNNISIYISEGYEMNNIKKSHLLSNKNKKGNISGNTKKEPREEWLNFFKN